MGYWYYFEDRWSMWVVENDDEYIILFQIPSDMHTQNPQKTYWKNMQARFTIM